MGSFTGPLTEECPVKHLIIKYHRIGELVDESPKILRDNTC